MKILVVTQYFWPENFKINDFCLQLANRGHQITVLTGKPNYPAGSFYKGYSFASNNNETWENIKIIRSPLFVRGSSSSIRLLLNALSFAFFCSLRVLFLKGKFDKIFVCQLSPFTVAIPALVAKKKFKLPIYFWIQDIWPDSLSATGAIKNRSVLFLVNCFVNYVYSHCKIILVQSKSFIGKIKSKKIEESKILFFPNSTELFYKPLSKNKKILASLPSGKKIIFAGNIGEAQSFDTLLEAAKSIKDKGMIVSWIILGDGRRKSYVVKKAKELGVDDDFIFLGSFPSSKMPEFFSCADALIVSLKKDPVFELTIPNKIQSYMACGKPIIASLDGEGAKVILESESGYVAPSEDSLALAEKVVNFFELTDSERLQMGVNARAYFDREFHPDKLIKRFESILRAK